MSFVMPTSEPALRQQSRAAGEILRELARAAAPYPWRVVRTTDGRVLLFSGHEQIAELTGPWAEANARYLEALSPERGISIAEQLTELGRGTGKPLNAAARAAFPMKSFAHALVRVRDHKPSNF